jgi:hypothetical protein
MNPDSIRNEFEQKDREARRAAKRQEKACERDATKCTEEDWEALEKAVRCAAEWQGYRNQTRMQNYVNSSGRHQTAARWVARMAILGTGYPGAMARYRVSEAWQRARFWAGVVGALETLFGEDLPDETYWVPDASPPTCGPEPN